MFLGKDVLKICIKFIGEHPCRSVISIKLQSKFIEITFRHGSSPVNLLHILRKPFPDNTYEQLLLLCDFNIDLVWVYSISISSFLYHCFCHFNTIQYTTSVIEICKLEGFEKF